MKKKRNKKILKEYHITKRSSLIELKNRQKLLDLYLKSPVPDKEKLENLGLYLTTKNFSRMLFFNEIYRQILNTEGVIMEFGIRWGQNLSILVALRGAYEPYNIKRKIIGFDTFEGFLNESEIDDGKYPVGSHKLPKNYSNYISNLLKHLEQENPASHIKKYEIIKGDASKTLKKYLDKATETIVSFAFFDMDIYKPTKKCLSLMKPHLAKGSILAFDELNCDMARGVTPALKEVFNLNKIKIKRFPHISRISYFIV
tara:strand:- start:2761 stop:3531 length:771 start_codon:yes stop_codon:yes gene_type:complete